MKKLRVLVAGRLSRKADRDQTGFDSQERDSIRWAAAHGHEVVAVVADYRSGRSGLESRPNLRPWVTDPGKLAQYDAIVALKVDRLTRGNREETAQLELWAREHGKQLVITGADVRFPSEGTEGVQWDLMLRMAHQEWINTSERYKRMQRTLRDAGSFVGRVPYGFVIAPAINAEGKPIKALIHAPAEAKVIEDAAARYLSGLSLAAICDWLNAAGRLPRQRHDRHQPLWTPCTLSGVLRNPVVIGRRLNAAGRTELRVPPILARETWDAVIARMDQRATRKGVSQSRSPALLTSIIRCGRCDRNMFRTGGGYYCHHGCQQWVAVGLADQLVHETMAADDRRDVIEVIIPGTGHDADIAEIKRDLAEAVEAEVFDRLPALRAELARLRALPAAPPRIELRESEHTVAEMWASMPDDSARRQYLLDRRAVVIYNDGVITANLRQPRPPLRTWRADR